MFIGKQRYWTQSRQRPDPVNCDNTEKPNEPKGSEPLQKECPARQIVHMLGEIANVPVILLENLAHVCYSLALVAAIYAVVVYVCHQAHPAGAPYLVIDGRHIALPYGQQIVAFAKKTGII